MIFFSWKKKKHVGEDMEKLEPSCVTGGNVKWCSCFGNTLAVTGLSGPVQQDAAWHKKTDGQQHQQRFDESVWLGNKSEKSAKNKQNAPEDV